MVVLVIFLITVWLLKERKAEEQRIPLCLQIPSAAFLLYPFLFPIFSDSLRSQWGSTCPVHLPATALRAGGITLQRYEISVWPTAGCSIRQGEHSLCVYSSPVGAALTFGRRITSADTREHKQQDESESCRQRQRRPHHRSQYAWCKIPNAFSDSTRICPRPPRPRKKKGMMMMIMVMATCKVRNPAEHNLNGFGMPQHVESHVKMQTQTTAVKQNGVQLLLPPYYIMHG